MPRPNRIWFRKSTGWWMVKINGRQHKLAKGKANKAEAEQKFHELMAQRCVAPESTNARVADVIEAFLDWSKIHLSPDTFRGHMYYGQKFAEACGFVQAIELKPLHITRWCDKKRAAGEWNETTEYNAKRTAFRIFSWAAEQKILPQNPLHGMKRPKPAPRERALTVEEYEAMYHASNKPFQRFLFALRYTGARPKEVRELRWSQVRSDHWFLSKHKTKKKTGKPRVIYLNAAMQSLMSELRQQTTSSEYVFLNCDGQPWTMNAVRLQIFRLKKKLGLKNDVCAYMLRHMWGTQAILNGVDVSTVAECMGHTSLEMVSTVYVHLAEQHHHLQDAMERATLSPDPTKPLTSGGNPSD